MHVHTVLVTLQHPKVISNAVYRGDMIFNGDEPVLVLEWAGERGASAPAVTVAMHRSCLTPAASQDSADYLHSEPLIDPRPRPEPAT